MALNFEQKKAVVADIAAIAAQAHSAVAAEYRGLTVEQMTDLRRKARDGGVFLRVAKNTLVRRAVEGTDFECIQEGLTGPLLFAGQALALTVAVGVLVIPGGGDQQLLADPDKVAVEFVDLPEH